MHEHIGTLDAHSKVLAFSAFKQTLFFVFGVAPHGQLKISLLITGQYLFWIPESNMYLQIYGSDLSGHLFIHHFYICLTCKMFHIPQTTYHWWWQGRSMGCFFTFFMNSWIACHVTMAIMRVFSVSGSLICVLCFHLVVIASPHGIRGSLTGCCPSDLVKQVYLR